MASPEMNEFQVAMTNADGGNVPVMLDIKDKIVTCIYKPQDLGWLLAWECIKILRDSAELYCI